MNSSSSGVRFETGNPGPRAIVTSTWSQEILKEIRSRKARSLELNTAFGWKDTDVAFLRDLTSLRNLVIINAKLKSVAPVENLKHLEELTIWPIRVDIDFTDFREVRECALTWNAGLRALLECVTLESVFLDRFKMDDLADFHMLTNLKTLGLINSSVKSLNGIQRLAKLKKIRLGNMGMLESLSGIEHLSDLEEINLDCCKRISNIDSLSGLPNLRRLYIDNCGDIESLSPLKRLANLERVTFIESTNIVDGDLSPLLRDSRVVIAFKNRKHYTHSREQLDPISHAKPAT